MDSMLVTPREEGRMGSGCHPAQVYIAMPFIKARVGPEGITTIKDGIKKLQEWSTTQDSRGMRQVYVHWSNLPRYIKGKSKVQESMQLVLNARWEASPGEPKIKNTNT